MLNQIKGLHHVTSMAADARANNDFFTDTLGLRRVKKTVNFDAPDVYHLYYGDEVGTPGSVMTYFPFPNIGRAGQGAGEVGTTVFSVPEGSLALLARAARRRRASTGLGRGRALRREAADASPGPDGDELRAGRGRTTPARPGPAAACRTDEAIRGFHGASLRLRDGGATDELLHFMGYEEVETRRRRRPASCREGGNGADVIDIETLPGAPPRRSRRGLGPPHRLRGAGPGDAARGAQGADRHRLPGDAGDRPRLLLGDLLPHAGRRAVRGRDQRAGLRPRRGHRASRRGAEAAAASTRICAA